MPFTFCTNCGKQIDDSLNKCPYCGHLKGADRTYTYGNAESTSDGDSEKDSKNAPGEGNNPYGQNNNPYGQNNNPYGQNNNPYGQNNNPYGQNNNPYGQNNNPYGQNNNPYGQNNNPYGQNNNPYGQNNNPYGQNNNPYGQNNNPYGQSNNPYGQNNNPYGQNNNPYGQNNNPYGQNNNPYGQGQNGGSGWTPPQGNQMYRPVPDRPLSAGLLIFSIINIVFGCCCSVGFIFGIVALVYTLNARQSPTDEEEIRRKKIAFAMNVIAVVLTVVFVASYVYTLTTTDFMNQLMDSLFIDLFRH